MNGDYLDQVLELEEPEITAECKVCGEETPYEPKMCCNGFECGCMGLPTEPPICSDKCWEKFNNE